MSWVNVVHEIIFREVGLRTKNIRLDFGTDPDRDQFFIFHQLFEALNTNEPKQLKICDILERYRLCLRITKSVGGDLNSMSAILAAPVV